MKTCPKCQTEYDESKKFCRIDGSPLVEKTTEKKSAQTSVLSCPQCGNALEAGKKFCRYCGAKLETGAQLFSEENEATVILAPPATPRALDPQAAKIARLEAQVKEEPRRLSLIIELAECYLEAKSAQQAVNLLKPSVAYAHEDIRFHLLLGKAQEALGNLPGALDSYLAASEHDAWNPEVEAALFREDFLLSTYPRSVDELAEMAAQKGSTQIWQLLARITETKGDFDKAGAFLKEAIQFTPEDVTILASLARISEKRQDREEAKQWHQRILALHPTSHASILFLAQTHYRQGEYEEAITYYERLLAQERNNRLYQLYWLLAKVKGSGLRGYERSVTDALQWQNLSADEKPLATELFVLAGKESLNQGDFADAEQHLLRAHYLSPSPDVAKLLAIIEGKKGDDAQEAGNLNQAIASYQRAVAYDPSDQTSAQKLAQLVSLRTQERRQKRQEVSRKVAQGTGLALTAAVLLGLGVLGYHKGREWLREPAPPQAEVAAVIDNSALSQEEFPSPTEPENTLPPAEEYGTKSDSLAFVAEPAKEQSRGLEEGQPQPPAAEPQQVAKTTEPPKDEPQQGSVITAKELEIRISGKGTSDANRSPEAIQQEIESHFAELQDAYEAERAADPSLMGSLVLELGIAPDGQTSRVRFRSAKIASKKLQDMILGLAREWRFSPATGAVQVSYPLLFLPPGMDAATISAWEKRTAALAVTQKRPQEEQPPPAPVQAEPVRERQYVVKQDPEPQPVTVRERLYEVVTPTLLRSEPRADAPVVTRLEPGIKVRIVGRVGDFLQVRSRKGNTPGYVSRADVVRSE